MMMSDLGREEKDLQVLAKTMYGEARGEYEKIDSGLSGLVAVGNVILNRWKTPNRFGKTIYETCLAPYQFSCWSCQDPNLDLLNSEHIVKQKVFNVCQMLAAHLIQDPFFPDLTQGANHYHAISMKAPPRWVRNRKPTLKLGGHIFYKL